MLSVCRILLSSFTLSFSISYASRQSYSKNANNNNLCHTFVPLCISLQLAGINSTLHYCQTMSIICCHTDVNKQSLPLFLSVAAATLIRRVVEYDLQKKRNFFSCCCCCPFSFLSKDKLLL